MLLKLAEYCRLERGGEDLLFNFTGDTMSQDEDGHFFFVGRNDDIITSSGYRIGPFDVESVVMEHLGSCRSGRDRQTRPGAHRNRQGGDRTEARRRRHRSAKS